MVRKSFLFSLRDGGVTLEVKAKVTISCKLVGRPDQSIFTLFGWAVLASSNKITTSEESQDFREEELKEICFTLSIAGNSSL